MKSIFSFWFLLASTTFVYAQPGVPDNSFSGDGKVTTSVMQGGNGASAILIQPDGKILTGGPAWNGVNMDFGLVRYTTGGVPDNTFNGDGIATLDFGIPGDDNLNAMALQADGKIVAAGTIDGPVVENMAVARFNSDGSPDLSFGTGGKIISSVNNANGVALQPDGKILVAGNILIDGHTDFAVLRYNSDGSPDQTFGINGLIITKVSSKDDRASSVLVQPDNKIVVTGTGSLSDDNCFAVVRYLPNGALDPLFKPDPIVKIHVGNGGSGYQGILQPDGKIVVAGTVYDGNGFPDFAMLRLNQDGKPDNSFGNGGVVITAFGNSTTSDYSFSLVLQSDGRLVQAGYSNLDVWDFSMARINSDGSPDLSFGNEGKVITAFNNSSDDECKAVAIQEDGKIVLAGRYMKNANSSFAVARYLAGCPSPFEVAITDITDSKATVNWTGNNSAYSYRIRKRIVGTTAWTYSSVLAPITTKTLSNNFPSTQYEVQVQSYCDSSKTDSSGYTSSVLFTSSGECLGTTSQSTTGITSTSATLNWTSPNTPAKWTIKYKVSGSPFTTVKISGALSSYNLSGLTASTNYDWKIMAKCGSETSEWSALQHFTTSALKVGVTEAVNKFSVYPNPANGVVSLQFTVGKEQQVNIKVYDLNGKDIATWLNSQMAEGDHTLSFDVSSFAKGIYFVRMISESGMQNQKLIVQ